MSDQGGDKPDGTDTADEAAPATAGFDRTVVMSDEARAEPAPADESASDEAETGVEPEGGSDLASTVAVDPSIRSSAPSPESEPPPFPSSPPPSLEPTPTPPSTPAGPPIGPSAPTPTPSPAPDPTPTPSPAPDPTPTPSPAPAPTPTPSPAPAPTPSPAPAPTPKPAASTAASQTATQISAPPRTGQSGWLLPVVGLTAFAGLIGYLVATRGPTPAPSVPPAATATATARPAAPPKSPPRPTTPPTAATEVTPPPASAPAPGPAKAAARAKAEDSAACVSAVLPLGSATHEDVAFVCEETTARNAARSMTTLIARSDAPTQSRLKWGGLGWYRMALVQVMRSRCCGEVAVLAEPPSMSSCGLGTALAAIDRAVVESGDLDAAGRSYFTAADCLFKNNAARAFGLRDPADASQLATLLALAAGR